MGTTTLLAAGVAALAQPAWAVPVTAHYFVDPTGSDTNTCRASGASSACRTITHAVDLAQARLGTGVQKVSIALAPGTYTEDVVIPPIVDGKSLRLVGAAATNTSIHGDGTGSVITVSGGTVSISKVTVTGGDTTFNDGVHGPNFGGGGIANAGSLTVAHSIISGNSAGFEGGGMSNTGVLTVTRSTISNNTAVADIDEFAGNLGGGIESSGTLTITDSTISGNTAAARGGGIESDGLVSITGSTISGNTAGTSSIYTGAGGGIYADTEQAPTGPITISNSTLTGNSALFGEGGAIYTSGTALTVVQSTFAHNTALIGGGIMPNFATLTTGGSVFLDSPCLIVFSTSVDNGYNVADDDSCEFGSSSPISTAAQLHLGALAANHSRGPLTMAITAKSSAHSVVPAASCLAMDERGMPRPGVRGASTCDAGAYELQSTKATHTTRSHR
jgi:hypothetical protein